MSIYRTFLRKPLLYLKAAVERCFGVSILFMSKNHRPLAVYSELGFWYAGDFLRMDDISYGILKNGIVEKHETKIVEKYLGPGTVFYDIGANTGYYGILAASRGAYSYFFEPVTEHTDTLSQSIALNHFEGRTSVISIALSDTVGEVPITLSGSGSSVVPSFLHDEALPKRTIKTDTLDRMVKNGLKPPSFIKIDVEGHELNVLLGAEMTIRKHLPVLFIELVSSMKERNFTNKNYEPTLRLLSSWGYKVFKEKEGELLSEFEKEDGVAMYLCLH